jgi:integrase
MAVYKEVRPSGKTSWVVKYLDNTGVRRTKRFRTRELAKDFESRVRVAVSDGSYVDPVLGKISLREYGEHVIATADIRPSTRALYEGFFRTHIAPRIGHRSLASIRSADVREFVAALQRDGVGISMVNHVYRLLRMILNVAVAEERIHRNPASKIRLPKEPEREAFFLTEAQVKAIAREAGEYGTLLRFLAYTGLRIGEAAALRVESLDLMRGNVRVVENAVEVRGKLIVGRPKTPNAIRSVPVPTSLRDDLTVLVAGKEPSDPVFTADKGGMLRPTHVRKRVLYPAARRAGVLRNGEPPRLHDLRHTFASLCAKAGFSIYEVSRMMGHSSIDITADRYTHLFPERRHEAHDRLDAMFAAAEEAASKDAEVIELR